MRWPVIQGAGEVPSAVLRVPVDLCLDREIESPEHREALRLAMRLSTILEAQADVVELLADLCRLEAKLQNNEGTAPVLLLSNVKLLAEEAARQASEKAAEVRKLAGVCA